MRIVASPGDLRALLQSDPIPLDVVCRMRQDRHLALKEEVEYANSLLAEAGTYLGGGWAIRRFIRAEISNEDALREIARQRELADRLGRLFPEIVRIMRVRTEPSVSVAFEIVFDTCDDYPAVLKSGRKDKNLKNRLHQMEALYKAAASLNRLISNSEISCPYGYQVTHRRYMKRVLKKDVDEAPYFSRLERDLKILEWHLELELYRARKNPADLMVHGNQAKTHLVDAAYGLVLSNGHPEFVTTPGSDFAYLCSLLYEISTGQADVSLAGAINRYARSAERAAADQNEIDHSDETSRARDEDNFYDIKNSKFGSDEQAAMLLAEVRDRNLSSEARVLAMLEMEEMVEEVENRDRIHGPFIMWADQMKFDWAAHRQESDAQLLAELRHDIETGKLRRSKRST